MNSSVVVIGDQGTAAQYNNLRLDVLSLGLVSLTAGAGGITQYDMVYVSASNTALKADADSIGTSGVLGIAQETIGAGSAIWIQTSGIVTNAGWALTAGQKIYLSTVAGGITQDAGSLIRAGKTFVELGIAITATKILLRIRNA